jgi:hypothetical protein
VLLGITVSVVVIAVVLIAVVIGYLMNRLNQS